jgi:hypothetical protein
MGFLPAVWPTYLAAVAAGDPGKLCAEGFILFDEFWTASDKHLEVFWTAFMGMASALSKQPKVDVDRLPEASYGEHTGDLVPEESAEDAPGARIPLVNWFGGPSTLPVGLASERPDYAPAYYTSRVEHGSFGSFNLAELIVAEGLPPLNSVREEDLVRAVREFHPPVKYQSFHTCMVKKELWPDFSTPENLERHAHSCLRIEVVAACPSNKNCTKMSKRGGVIVQVRCTVCGETHLIMVELSREDFKTMTGFTIKGKPVGGPKGEPLMRLNLKDLLEADEFINAHN